MRDTLNIHFDTRIQNKDKNEEDLRRCKHRDQDPLNDCKPVNCETYYNGKKSYFDKHSKRCTKVALCTDKKRNKASQIYDQKNNRCINRKSVNNEDIDFIKSLSNNERHAKDLILIQAVSKPVETGFTTEGRFQVLDIINNTQFMQFKSNLKSHNIIKYLMKNKYTLIVLLLVIIMQCCLIITIVCCPTDDSAGCYNKKVVRKFFNYRQDVSVTTPLIGTSNMDTGNTEFDFISESSNIDKKIKCYKACQKKGQNNDKMSMSDDILLKCMNRRDWNSKINSNTIRNITGFEIKRNNKDQVKENEVKYVNQENNKHEENMLEDENNKRDLESINNASEKEIKCHNYNFMTSVDLALDNVDLASTNKKAPSLSTEKGAQACFSNDSIDDFLSERGMIYLAENASKYSFTSNSSPEKSSFSEKTSKTSKNNILKNVLSYLTKSKVTSSDPGIKKSNSKNLELLHISHASVYTSSSELNNKIAKDSRSTF